MAVRGERLRRARYQPGASYVARRPFHLGGHLYRPGEAISPLYASKRIERLLYDGMRIREAVSIGLDGQNLGAHILTNDGQAGGSEGGVDVVSLGGGWYNVMRRDGTVITSKPVRRGQAEALARAHE